MSNPIGIRAAERNGFLDSLRFVAALGIVLFHLKLTGASIGLSALSFFAAVLCYFASKYSGENGFEYQVNRLNQRIAWPWMIWSTIYLLAKLAEAQVSGLPYSSQFEPFMWWTGPSLHLWWLPFAFTLSLLLTQLVAPIQLSTSKYAVLVLCLWPVCMGCGYFMAAGWFDTPWVQWLSVLPASVLGVLLAAADRHAQRLLLLAVAVIVTGLSAHYFGFGSLPLQFLIGGLTALVAVSWNPGGNRLTVWLGSISLGIYLAHPLCFAIARHITNQHSTWVNFVLTVVLSIALADAYRRLELMLKKLLAKRYEAAV